MLRMRNDEQIAEAAHSVEEITVNTGGAVVAEAGDGLPFPRRAWAIVAVSFGTALFVLDGTVANVALPSIARDLGVEEGVAVNVVTLYQLVMVMTLLPFSNLGERFGLRRIYQIGQVIFMAASAMVMLAHSLPLLLALRVAQALGAGMALSVTSAMIRQIYPRAKLGSGLGINSVIVASSSALAPVLGGFIVAHFDWRWIFVSAVPFAIISLLIGRFLPEPHADGGRFDWRSGLWSAASFALIVGGIEIAAHGGQLVAGIAASVAGLLSALLLARRERTHQSPVFPVDLLAKPTIAWSAMAAVAGFVGSAALIVALPFRLQQEMGFSPEQAGLLILPFPLTMLVVAPAAGWLSDRVSPSVLGMVGMAIALVGLLFVAFTPIHAAAFTIAWRLSLCALGFGLFFSPNARMLVGNSPRQRAAAAGGLLATSRLFGQTLGAAGVGVLLTVSTGKGDAPMIFGIVFVVLAALCSLARWLIVERAPEAA
ncbi:MFS transporter DHA2 family multidrug resistance protein [Novosphingobium sp. Rr 2-17]|nr:MFS transporter DHA2 family multidrug resistance protein [Novosphingobium sp. Rr 2-17]